VIYPGSTPVGNATLVVANVLTCNKYSPICIRALKSVEKYQMYAAGMAITNVYAHKTREEASSSKQRHAVKPTDLGPSCSSAEGPKTADPSDSPATSVPGCTGSPSQCVHWLSQSQGHAGRRMQPAGTSSQLAPSVCLGGGWGLEKGVVTAAAAAAATSSQSAHTHVLIYAYAAR
jgi:hypothetical protein